MDKYSTFDVARLFHIDRTRLHEWLKGGYVTPCRLAHGKGTRTEFTREDLYRLQLFIRLLHAFRNRTIAKEFSNVDFHHVGPEKDMMKYGRWEFSFTGDAPLGKGELLKETPSVRPLGDGQVVVVIDLASVKADVDRRLAE
jgi:hypothetical protein